MTDKRKKLIQDIEEFIPYNEQEEKDKTFLLRVLHEQEDVFCRSNQEGHMSSSCWIVNQDRTKVLLCFHKIYQSWTWLGGHADGEEDLLAVALREAKEESSLIEVMPVSSKIYSLEVLTVDGHEKRGEYISSHLHLNVTYLLQADENALIKGKDDENAGVKWFPVNDVLKACSEPWFVQRIYPKLIAKLKDF